MVQITQKKNSSVDRSKGSETEYYRPGYKLQLTKKLNPLAYMVIGSIYTLAVVVTTLHLADDGQSSSQNRYSKYNETNLKEEILSEITKLKEKTNPRIDSDIERQMELMRKDLIGEVNKINLKYIDMIENKDIYKDSLISDLTSREPASQKIKKGKALVYNKVNERVLRYKHRKRYDRAEESYKIKKQNLMATLDLNSESDRKKLKDFEDEKDLALYELRTRQRYIRRQFEKQKYIVLNK